MGRRKRKQVMAGRRNVVPKIFVCPKCGKRTVKPVNLRKRDMETVTIRCGHCGIEEKVYKNNLTEGVDAYGEFIDIYYKDREYERLLEKVDLLWEQEQYSELTMTYAYLIKIAHINSEKAQEEYQKSKDPSGLNDAERWEEEAETFADNRQQLLDKIASGELVDADLDESIYAEVEDNPFEDASETDAEFDNKVKKRTDIEDVLGDTGFLEW